MNFETFLQSWWDIKFKKYSGEINLFRIHRNIKGCIPEVNSEEPE